jgi:hypothetical protein
LIQWFQRHFSQQPAYYDDENAHHNSNSNSVLPSGWEPFRDDRNRVVYFNKSTGKMESNFEDLFKKTRSFSSPPRAPRHSPNNILPRPDIAKSCSTPFIVTPGNAVTRVPGVIDLLSSSEGRPDSTDNDEETDLDAPRLPTTEEFDYQHHGSDGGRDDD